MLNAISRASPWLENALTSLYFKGIRYTSINICISNSYFTQSVSEQFGLGYLCNFY